MGHLGYQAYAKASYGVEMSENEAQQQREDFFDLYPALVGWHNKYRGFAKNKGFVSSPLGRVRHLPMIWSKDREIAAGAERQAINSPIQATLSDLCLWAITLLEQQYADKGLWIAGMTHDSLYGYYPMNSPIDWPRVITETMSNLPIKETFGWDHQIPFPADIEVGPNMGNLEEVKLA
jgi:DNA polymerase I-like protein with 3'-5' exonuclease and polymerase domains